MADHGSFRSGFERCVLGEGPHKSGVSFTEPTYRRVENVGKTEVRVVDATGREHILYGGDMFEGYLLEVMAEVTKDTSVHVTDEIPPGERAHVIN